MAYTLDIAIVLGTSQTGLTLSAQLVDTAGANVGGTITSGFTEIGQGNYLWHYTNFPDGHRGGVKFSAGATLKAFAAINPEEAENVDTKTSTRPAAADYTSGRAAKLDLLGTGTAFSAGPVASSGDITIVRGDAYFNADGKALEWTDTTWPALTGATVVFSTRPKAGAGNTLTNIAMIVVTASKVRLELTSAQTATLTVGAAAHSFDVQATLASGRVVTLTRGNLTVLEDIS